MTDEDREIVNKDLYTVHEVLERLLDKEKSVDRAIMATTAELLRLEQDIEGLKSQMSDLQWAIRGRDIPCRG